MNGRHRKPIALPAGTCPVCVKPVDFAEAAVTRPGELAWGAPLHDVCYQQDVIEFGPPQRIFTNP